MNPPCCAGVSQGESASHASQAHSVPAVPGASGDKPEPKPSAIACAGCASMKRALARGGSGGRVVALRGACGVEGGGASGTVSGMGA